jgi:hypothetical protein
MWREGRLMQRLVPAAAPALAAALAVADACAQETGRSSGDSRIPDPAEQLAAAVLPLPDELREGAAVLGYAADGRLVELRRGAGDMVCLADDPRDQRFHVACYHRSLEPFMARGRQLRAQGLSPEAADSLRSAEIASGAIPMPPAAALYSLTGPAGSFDAATGTAGRARPLFVVYVPFATAASTGLPTRPARGTPWLMNPGTPRAHIMYQPAM